MDIATEITVLLKLTEREALWLKDTMQNPFYQEESPTDKMMREVFFKTLQSKISR